MRTCRPCSVGIIGPLFVCGFWCVSKRCAKPGRGTPFFTTFKTMRSKNGGQRLAQAQLVEHAGDDFRFRMVVEGAARLQRAPRKYSGPGRTFVRPVSVGRLVAVRRGHTATCEPRRCV